MERTTQKKDALRRVVTIRPLHVFAVLIPLLLIFGISCVSLNARTQALKAEVEALKADVLDAYALTEELEARLRFTETDDYIMQEARRRFGYLAPGETRYVLE